VVGRGIFKLFYVFFFFFYHRFLTGNSSEIVTSKPKTKTHTYLRDESPVRSEFVTYDFIYICYVHDITYAPTLYFSTHHCLASFTRPSIPCYCLVVYTCECVIKLLSNFTVTSWHLVSIYALKHVRVNIYIYYGVREQWSENKISNPVRPLVQFKIRIKKKLYIIIFYVFIT